MLSSTIIKTRPNALCAQLHARMPVILGPQNWPAWLGEEPAEAARPKAMLAPYSSDEDDGLVGERWVGNVKNSDARLIKPVAALGP
jgi:putative SOS response-associated peptidase YedK